MNVFWSLNFIILAFILNISLCDKTANYFFYTYKSNGGILVNSSDTRLNEVTFPNWTAQAFYNASQNLTGWDILELWTNPELNNEDQAFHAGYLEGYITRQQIWYYYYNNIERIASNEKNYLHKILKDYFAKNNNYIQMMTTKYVEDPYWHQVGLLYKQIDGILNGYNNATADQKITTETLTLNQLLYISFLEELSDIYQSYLNPSNTTEPPKGNETDHIKHHPKKTSGNLKSRELVEELEAAGTHCSVLIKILPGNTDVLIAHDTWAKYSQMTRIFKRYKFPFKMNNNSTDIIPGMSVAFSGYPGSIASVDDFYVINSGLVVLETTNDIYNMSMFSLVRPDGEVLEEVRNVVANRMAASGSEWTKVFKKYNSGTYNNQWMIIDLNYFKPGFDPKEKFFTVVEQAPGLMRSDDLTSHLLQYGYWASYNIPYFPEMYNVTGDLQAAENDSWNSYTECPRAKIFKANQEKVTDLDTMMWMMRYNYYKTDPYSICKTCNPPAPNPCNTISSRCDVSPVKNDSSNVRQSAFGAIDAKITSFSLFSKGEIIAISGPSTSGVPPFSWDNPEMNTNKRTRHLGQPIIWNFPQITTSWLLPYTTNTSLSTKPDDPMPTTTEQSSGKKPKKNSSYVTQPLPIVSYLFITLYLISRM